jgi:hypothetical protein
MKDGFAVPVVFCRGLGDRRSRPAIALRDGGGSLARVVPLFTSSIGTRPARIPSRGLRSVTMPGSAVRDRDPTICDFFPKKR